MIAGRNICSTVSCGNDVVDVFVFELDELVDNPGTTDRHIAFSITLYPSDDDDDSALGSVCRPASK